MLCLLHCSLPYNTCILLLASLTYVHDLPAHLYMPQLFTHCLLAIICVAQLIVMYMIKHLCFCNICCSTEMPWDYFVHVCHGPPSFAIFDFEVYCLLFQLFVCI